MPRADGCGHAGNVGKGADSLAVAPSRSLDSSRHERTAAVKRHVCGTCGRAFTRFGNLRIHQLNHSSKKQFACKSCGRSFALSGQLKVHTLHHHGNAAFVCHVCDRRLTTARRLQQHLLRHAPGVEPKLQPNVCGVCGRGFTRSYGLKIHMRSHEGIKPYVCACGRAFTCAHYLRQHEEVHAGQKFSCKLCGRSFTRSGSLTAHTLHVHGSDALASSSLSDAPRPRSGGAAAGLQLRQRAATSPTGEKRRVGSGRGARSRAVAERAPAHASTGGLSPTPAVRSCCHRRELGHEETDKASTGCRRVLGTGDMGRSSRADDSAGAANQDDSAGAANQDDSAGAANQDGPAGAANQDGSAGAAHQAAQVPARKAADEEHGRRHLSAYGSSGSCPAAACSSAPTVAGRPSRSVHDTHEAACLLDGVVSAGSSAAGVPCRSRRGASASASLSGSKGSSSSYWYKSAAVADDCDIKVEPSLTAPGIDSHPRAHAAFIVRVNMTNASASLSEHRALNMTASDQLEGITEVNAQTIQQPQGPQQLAAGTVPRLWPRGRGGSRQTGASGRGAAMKGQQRCLATAPAMPASAAAGSGSCAPAARRKPRGMAAALRSRSRLVSGGSSSRTCTNSEFTTVITTVGIHQSSSTVAPSVASEAAVAFTREPEALATCGAGMGGSKTEPLDQPQNSMALTHGDLIRSLDHMSQPAEVLTDASRSTSEPLTASNEPLPAVEQSSEHHAVAPEEWLVPTDRRAAYVETASAEPQLMPTLEPQLPLASSANRLAQELQSASTANRLAQEPQSAPTANRLAQEPQSAPTANRLAQETQSAPTANRLAQELPSVCRRTYLAQELLSASTANRFASELLPAPTDEHHAQGLLPASSAEHHAPEMQPAPTDEHLAQGLLSASLAEHIAPEPHLAATAEHHAPELLPASTANRLAPELPPPVFTAQHLPKATKQGAEHHSSLGERLIALEQRVNQLSTVLERLAALQQAGEQEQSVPRMRLAAFEQYMDRIAVLLELGALQWESLVERPASFRRASGGNDQSLSIDCLNTAADRLGDLVKKVAADRLALLQKVAALEEEQTRRRRLEMAAVAAAEAGQQPSTSSSSSRLHSGTGQPRCAARDQWQQSTSLI